MHRRVRALLLCLCLCLGSLAVPGTAAGADQPSLDVTVDGTSMADGDRYSTSTPPRIVVNASVAPGTASNVTIDEVVVRYNGDTVHRSNPDERSVLEPIRAELSAGNNTVRVIVIDTAGGVVSKQFEVYKDDTAPFVYLSSPYETQPLHTIPDRDVSAVDVTFAGQFVEDSTVQQLTLTHDDGGNHSKTRTINEPGTGFEFDTRLALGENDVTLTVRDSFGNTRSYGFTVNVTDATAPEIDLDDADTETTDRAYYVSGTVTDDVWVKKVTASVDKVDGNHTINRTVASGQSYDPTNDRRSVPFNQSFLLNVGTYEVTVTATDHTGNETTRTYTVNRTLRDAESIAPDVAVVEDKTLFLTDSTLFLSGRATDGETERVSVETRNVTTGDTTDFTVVHSGSVRETVEFGTRTDVGPGVSKVIVRATDSTGAEHTATIYVNATSGVPFVSESGARRPGVRVTSLSDGDPTTASANVEVDPVDAGQSVRIPPSDSDRRHLTSTENVTLGTLAITPSESSGFELYVKTTEHRAGAASDFASATGATPVGTVTVEHAVTEDDLADVTFRFRVDRAYLSDRGVTPGNVTLYRRQEGTWNALNTTHLRSTDAAHVVEATSPGLSVFGLGSPRPAPTTSNETDAAENGTARNETQSNGTAQFAVTNVTKNATRIVPNGTVGVNVTVANDGSAEGTYTAGLALNATIADTQTVTVGPGETETVTFETQVAREGNYSVLVNGTSAGYLLVKERGLIGSIVSTITGLVPSGLVPGFVGGALSGLPLKLIGMALGGLVGVIVVASFALRILQRLGGSGESE
jgi:hypothetical protein